MKNKMQINHPPAPALKRRGSSILKPLLFKEGLGWLILSFCPIFFCAGSVFGSWVDSSGDFSCSGYSGSERIVTKGSQPLSAPIQGWTDTCAHLKEWEAVNPGNEEEAQKQYDTLRIYIEKCAPSDCMAAGAFRDLDAANQFRSNDTNRYTQYRAWLLRVLYLNKTCEDYFCSDIAAIETTYQKTLEVLAVMNYLRQNHPNCWGSSGDRQYSQDSATAAHSGYDPNHLPSLDSLGLGILLKSAVSLSTGSNLPSQYLASFTSSPNPFNKETTLQFTLNRMTYTTVSVFDELGRLVWGDGRGSSLEAGTHTIHLNGKALPSGTLYARISTGFGEVKTVKLIHE